MTVAVHVVTGLGWTELDWGVAEGGGRGEDGVCPVAIFAIAATATSISPSNFKTNLLGKSGGGG